jgi:hypothetical protein
MGVVDDVVEAELVDTLGGGDDAEPVTELLLLEVLLGAVVSTSKGVYELRFYNVVNDEAEEDEE